MNSKWQKALVIVTGLAFLATASMAIFACCSVRQAGETAKDIRSIVGKMEATIVAIQDQVKATQDLVKATNDQVVATRDLVIVESTKFKHERLRILHADYGGQLAYNRDIRCDYLRSLYVRPEKGPKFDEKYDSYSKLLRDARELHTEIANALARGDYKLVEEQLPVLYGLLKGLSEAYSEAAKAFYER